MRNMRSRESNSLDGHGPDIVPSLRLEISRASHPIGSAPRSTTLSTIAGIRENDIERWQASAFTEATGDDEGIVARLLRSCIDSISHLLLSLKSASTCKHLRRSLAILKIWCDGHSVWKGKLDSMLERSKGLRHTTLSILNPLCKALTSGIHKYAGSEDSATVRLRIQNSQIYSQTRWLLKETEGDISDSDSDSDSCSDNISPAAKGGDEGIERMVKEVKMHVNCLIDLSSALEFPAIDPQPIDEPSVLKIEQRAAHDYHVDLITAKFPKVQAQLAERLGRISWARYQRMQQEREVNASIAAPEEEDMAALAPKSHMLNSEFRDSGLGTSLPVPPTRYAETALSFMTSITGGKRVDIPPLPPKARTGLQFECNACGRCICALNNREWRKHLYLDLQPYTCLFAECAFGTKPFADRQLWSNHLELDHRLGPLWESMTCPLCFESTDSGKSKMLIHFARHMEDVALAALPREVESDSESEIGTGEGSHGSSGSLSLLRGEEDDMKENEAETMIAGNADNENSTPQARASKDAPKDLSASNSGVRTRWDRGSYQLPGVDINRTHPLMIGTDFANCRCKVFELKKNDWFDRGTGYAKVVEVEQVHWNIVVWSEDDDQSQMLLLTPISHDDGFQMQDTLIVWTAHDGTDLALSFQNIEGCSVVWKAINEVQEQANHSGFETLDVSNEVRVSERASSFRKQGADIPMDPVMAQHLKEAQERGGPLSSSVDVKLTASRSSSPTMPHSPKRNSYPCSRCNETFDLQGELEKHSFRKHGKRLSCTHSFKVIKSDNTLVSWNCNLCHTGPYQSVYECQHCKLKTCRPCASKS